MKHATPPASSLLTLADIVGVYGIKGWVKLRVQLDEPQLLLSFQHLQLSGPQAAKNNLPRKITVEALQQHGKGFIARLGGIADRTQAELLKGLSIQVPEADFPAAAQGEVYWRDLLGLKVWCSEAGNRVLLGTVKSLLETGANDVLVVSPCEGSVDNREHLVPWLPGDVVGDIDLTAGQLEVRWYVDE